MTNDRCHGCYEFCTDPCDRCDQCERCCICDEDDTDTVALLGPWEQVIEAMHAEVTNILGYEERATDRYDPTETYEREEREFLAQYAAEKAAEPVDDTPLAKIIPLFPNRKKGIT